MTEWQCSVSLGQWLPGQTVPFVLGPHASTTLTCVGAAACWAPGSRPRALACITVSAREGRGSPQPPRGLPASHRGPGMQKALERSLSNQQRPVQLTSALEFSQFYCLGWQGRPTDLTFAWFIIQGETCVRTRGRAQRFIELTPVPGTGPGAPRGENLKIRLP